MSEKHRFSFSNYNLTKIFFNINEDFSYENGEQEGIEINPKIEIDYSKNEKQIVVKLNIEFNNPNAPFKFDIGIAGFFDFNFDTTNENMESVVHVNCVALLYPFLRETIADITRRAGFPPLILPPINFIKLFQNKKKAEKET